MSVNSVYIVVYITLFEGHYANSVAWCCNG